MELMSLKDIYNKYGDIEVYFGHRINDAIKNADGQKYNVRKTDNKNYPYQCYWGRVQEANYSGTEKCFIPCFVYDNGDKEMSIFQVLLGNKFGKAEVVKECNTVAEAKDFIKKEIVKFKLTSEKPETYEISLYLDRKTYSIVEKIKTLTWDQLELNKFYHTAEETCPKYLIMKDNNSSTISFKISEKQFYACDKTHEAWKYKTYLPEPVSDMRKYL